MLRKVNRPSQLDNPNHRISQQTLHLKEKVKKALSVFKGISGDEASTAEGSDCNGRLVNASGAVQSLEEARLVFISKLGLQVRIMQTWTMPPSQTQEVAYGENQTSKSCGKPKKCDLCL